MCPWAPEPSSTERLEGEAPSAEEASERTGVPSPRSPLSSPWWIRILPFFASAFFFLSGVFVIFAPLPLLSLNLRWGRRWAWMALVTNSLIIALAAGLPSLAVYGVLVAVFSLIFPEFLRHRNSIEKSVALTLLGMALAGGLAVSLFAQIQHVHPIAELKGQVSSIVDYVAKSMPPNSASNVSPADLEDWKANILTEFPSAVGIFALVMVWANFVLLVRSGNTWTREKLGVDLAVLKTWKAPEWLVWPTILTGFFLVVDVGRVSDVAVNCFKFLMAVYAIQGLSILSFFFDLWNVKGFFRWVGYATATLVMMPLLLSLGFFDLWFDFRSKFRQS